MSHHPAFLLGQALEALAAIADATDLDTALAVASTALAGIVPATGDRPGVERGAHTPIGGGAGAPPAVIRAGSGAGARQARATATPAPSPHLQVVPDLIPCTHIRGGYTCTRATHPENPMGHVYMSGSWVPDRHQGAS
jgi:hypothetical protein